MDRLGGPMDGLAGLVHGLSYIFFVFYLIDRDGWPTISIKVRLTMAFGRRR
jgi:hypothetical protein